MFIILSKNLLLSFKKAPFCFDAIFIGFEQQVLFFFTFHVHTVFNIIHLMASHTKLQFLRAWKYVLKNVLWP